MEILVAAHAAFSHFPIALLVISFGATLVGRLRPDWRIDTFPTLAGGVAVGLLSVATGLFVHEPYEHHPIISEIQLHQFTALIGTFVVITLTVLRFLGRRKGHDLGDRGWYPIVAGAGLVWILAVGTTGGDLVYEHGINVRGIDPLHATE